MSNNSWQKVQFDQICKNISDRIDDPKQAKTNYYVGLQHLDSEDPKISRHGSPQDVSKTKLLFKPGHILFGKRNWYLRRLAVAERGGICSAHMLVLEPIEGKTIKEFVPLLMFGDDFYEKALMVSAGSMSPTIKWKDISKLEFLIPSISEQENILSIIQKIDNTISNTQNLLEKTKNYLKSKHESLLTRGIGHTKFKKVKWLYGNTIEIPDEWELSKLNNVATIHGRIGWKNLRSDEYLESGYLMLSVWSLVETSSYGIDFKAGVKRLSKFRYDESPEIQLHEGDVLVAKDGDIGRIGFIKKLPEPATVNSHVVPVRVDGKLLDSEFVYWFFKTNLFQTYCKAYTTGSTVPLFTQKDLRDSLIFIPNKEEQKKIISILNEIQEQVYQQQSHLLNLKTMRKSILNLKLIQKEKVIVTN